MSFRRYNPYDRYRKRSLHRISGFLAVLAIMTFSAFTGFYFGKGRTTDESTFLQQKVNALTAERDSLQNDVTNLRSEARTAILRLEELQKTYQSKTPGGAEGDLIALVNQQIVEGGDPERLAFLIRSGRPPRNCTDPEIQRFVVSTPAYTGAESQANIGQGAILIKAAGSSARNDKGESEAWYDPSKVVDLQFIAKDGKTEKKHGIMPLYHSIVLEGREYRFTVSEGARSFAKVTFNSCDYP